MKPRPLPLPNNTKQPRNLFKTLQTARATQPTPQDHAHDTTHTSGPRTRHNPHLRTTHTSQTTPQDHAQVTTHTSGPCTRHNLHLRTTHATQHKYQDHARDTTRTSGPRMRHNTHLRTTCWPARRTAVGFVVLGHLKRGPLAPGVVDRKAQLRSHQLRHLGAALHRFLCTAHMWRLVRLKGAPRVVCAG